MKEIVEGILKFQRDAFPERAELFKGLATRQNPKALFISCSDSRRFPNWSPSASRENCSSFATLAILFPPGPEPGGVSASVEYAVAALRVSDIVICGHSDCGAMAAISSCACLDHMPAVSHWLRYADSARVVNEARSHADAHAKAASMVRENVLAQLANIQTHPCVRLALAEGRIALHGWIYDIESGSVSAFDGASGRFVSLADHPRTRAVAPAHPAAI